MANYLMNAWYIAANSEEVGGKPLCRTLLETKIVLFRTESGEVGALVDRCPHRMAPLSRGDIVGETIRCGYHGLGFSTQGKCISALIPPFPAGVTVRSFPVVERYGLIWIWPGDPRQATPDLIPNLSHIDRARADGRWVLYGYTYVKTNYQIETDNLLDLSHIELVHRGTFGGQGVIQQGKFEFRKAGAQVEANWWMPGVKCPLPGVDVEGDGMVDHWLDMLWMAPSAMRLQVGYGLPGRVDPKTRVNANDGFQTHILTPETESTTHYFWSATQTTDLTAGFGADTMRGALMAAFQNEDKPLLEAVQDNMVQEFWAENPLILRSDGGGVLARRVLEELIALESPTP